MVQQRTTLSEISKALGVSIATVSKSLSDSSEISAPTKRRVCEFARKRNYKPNHFAASFRKGCSKTIGLIIPNLLNPFYAKVLVGIEKHLAQEGYKLITSISNESRYKESKSLNEMACGYIDGLIICASKETEVTNRYNHINKFKNEGTPIVMFDRICKMIDCDKVIINDYKASFNATEHLIRNKGCRNVIMTSLIDDLHHGKLRALGFKNAMEARNFNTEGKIIVGNSVEDLEQKLISTLEKDSTIDGIFSVNGEAVLQAIHITQKFSSNNSKEKIIIAGFCNQRQANSNPSLIIVNQNAEEIGNEAAKLILKRIKKTEVEEFQTKTITTNLN